VLLVCTGNVCRSPVAQQLLRAELDARLPRVQAVRVRVESAGTAAAVGWDIDPLAAHVLTERGGSAEGLRARQLTAGQLRDTDLALVMTLSHGRACVRLDPASAPRVHTLRGAARLLEGLEAAGPGAEDVVARGRALVNHLATYETELPPDADLDIPDPVGLPLEAFERVTTQIEDALRPVVRVLTAR
jgi:protein-tyrosine phosphatase